MTAVTDEELTAADIECQLTELAAYHAALFSGAASRIDASHDAIAHALFLLAAEALRQRKEWLKLADV